ncbi:MAG: substrate-binding domain-containing protein [Butyrivibrio sp.]|nr:substrate-binding domain-containing protein [Butyrivibrio sp.]
MKKIITCLLMGILMVTALVGCGQASTVSAAEHSGGKKILFIMPDLNDVFRISLSNAIISEGEAKGVTVDLVQTGKSVEAQYSLVESAKKQGYSAIIMKLADASTALQMDVASNGLPIVYVNNKPKDEHLEADKYIYVASNEEEAGRLQAEYVLKKLGNPSSMNVIIIEGEPGHSGTIGRTSAVKKTLKDNGCNANYVFVDYGNWSDSKAEDLFDIFTLTGQDVDAVFCNNDTMALGVIEAMKKNGYSYKDIPVCGVDATSNGCASIEKGEISFSVLQNAKGQGAAAVDAAIALSKGESIKNIEYATEDCKYIFIPFEPVDASNVSNYR